ncbi:MAG: OmpH family outer membrane protein [Wolbachia endosymbiont of Tyrophagus putrescentiae]|nr:OmpH family outer membrane protein [Wolbachia endosymbiont of Tyrophagus putrescentiae]
MKYLHLCFLAISMLFSIFAVYIVYNRSECGSYAHATATVDNYRILDDLLVIKDIQQQVEEQGSKLRKEFEQELEKFKPSEEEFNLLSEEAKKEKMEQFNKYAEKARESYVKKVTALEGSYKKVIDNIFGKIKEITEKIAKSEEIDLVLLIPKNQILYSKDAVDLSDKVLKSMNKDMPKFTLEIAE